MVGVFYGVADPVLVGAMSRIVSDEEQGTDNNQQRFQAFVRSMVEILILKLFIEDSLLT